MSKTVQAQVATVLPEAVGTGRAPQTPAFGSPAWWTFYWALPLMMALPLGWYGAGLAAELPLPASLVLWCTVVFISWWMSDLLFRLLARWLEAWSLPPWSLLIVGYMLNLFASSAYNPWVVEFLVRAGLTAPSPTLTQYFEIERTLLDPAYVWMLILAGLPGLVCWVAGNLALELIGGVPRLRHGRGVPAAGAVASGLTRADADEQAPPLPRFFERLQRLQDLAPRELLAVEAADHYIQVHTTRGKELVHYRFGDAVAELEAWDGLRIHRSAWVAGHGVKRLDESGRSLAAILVTGDRLPSACQIAGLRGRGSPAAFPDHCCRA